MRIKIWSNWHRCGLQCGAIDTLSSQLIIRIKSFVQLGPRLNTKLWFNTTTTTTTTNTTTHSPPGTFCRLLGIGGSLNLVVRIMKPNQNILHHHWGESKYKKRVIEVDNMIAEFLDFQVKAYQLPNFFRSLLMKTENQNQSLFQAEHFRPKSCLRFWPVLMLTLHG